MYDRRIRRCDLSYLREPYHKPDRSVGFRCAAEPVAQYVRKGGASDDTIGRICLCNGLIAAIGLGHDQTDQPTHPVEAPVLTAGEDVKHVARFLAPGSRSYRAAEVIRQIME